MLLPNLKGTVLINACANGGQGATLPILEVEFAHIVKKVAHIGNTGAKRFSS